MTKHASMLRLTLLALIIFGGTLLRYTFNLETVVDNPIRGDATSYVTYAHNLLEYSTFSKDRENIPPVPDSYWSPGYPAFLALLIKVSRLLGIHSYSLVLNCQLIIGVLTIFLCYLVSKTILPGYWPLVPSSLAAVSPHLISSSQLLLTETVFGFLMILSIYTLLRGIKTKHELWLLISGVCFGLTYLVNPVSFFVAPLLALLYVWQAAKTKHITSAAQLRKGLFFLAPLIIVVTVWSVRNIVSVPETSLGASGRLLDNLIIGMHSDFHDIWRADPRDPNNPATNNAALIQGSYATFFHVLANRVSEQPLSMMKWYLLQKPILLWSWDIRVGFGDIYIYPVFSSLYHKSKIALLSYSIMRAMHFWLVAAAILGTFFLFKKKMEESISATMIYLCLFSVSLIYVVAQAEPRYSIPLRTELYICAVYFLWNTVEAYKNYKGKSPAANTIE